MSIGELSFTLVWILMGPLGLDTDSFCGLCGIEWPILVFGASRLLMRLLRSLLELVSPGSESNSSVVLIIRTLVFLYKLLGYAAFVGISVAVLFLPLNHFTSTAFASVQDKLVCIPILLGFDF